MNSNIRSLSVAAAVVFGLSAGGARASSVEIDQPGQLHSGSYLDSFYVGGYAGNTLTSGPLTGNSQYGPGPNAGFTFSSNANVQSSGTNQGKFENLPTGDLDGNTQVLFFSGAAGAATTDTIDFAAGFNAISLNYSLDGNSSANNGTTVACSSRQDAYCTWSAATLGLSATAESITFGSATGAASNMEFDAVTVSAVPLPAA